MTKNKTKSVVQRKESYHHGDLRAQLVNATRALVEEKGPENFSVSEACRAAGVSTAAPYRHFADKGEMLIAVAIDGVTRLRGKMLAALEGVDRGSAQSVAAIGLEYVKFAMAEQGVFRLSFSLTKHHRDSNPMMEAGQATYDVLLNEVRLYLRKPDIDVEVRQTGFTLWSQVHGTSFLLIDEKVDEEKIELDLPALMKRTAERLLGPRPPE